MGNTLNALFTLEDCQKDGEVNLLVGPHLKKHQPKTMIYQVFVNIGSHP